MTETQKHSGSFFSEEGVETEQIPLGSTAVPFGLTAVANPSVGVGGAYGTWGERYDNSGMPSLIQRQLGRALPENELMELDTLGFINRHRTPDGLTHDQDVELEVEVGARL